MDNLTVNQRLTNLRISKGVDVSELSKKTGISDDALYSYERELNPAKPRLSKIKILADYYGVSVNYILKGEDAPSTEIPEWGKQLFEQINKLMSAQQSQQEILNKVLGKFSGSQSSDNVFPLYYGKAI